MRRNAITKDMSRDKEGQECCALPIRRPGAYQLLSKLGRRGSSKKVLERETRVVAGKSSQ